MSWLSGITGKAEDFLNKLDKSAAEAFHIEEETGRPASITPSEQSTYLAPKTSSSSISTTPSLTSIVPSRIGPPANTSTPKVGSNAKTSNIGGVKSSTAKKKDSLSDEALFDFLNSKEPAEGNKKRVTPISSRHHSRQSSTSSMRSGSGRTIEQNEEGVAEVTGSLTTESAMTTSTHSVSGSFLFSICIFLAFRYCAAITI